MSKKSVLKEAEDIIYGDREKTYGHPSKNLKTIAQMWTSYINSASGTLYNKEGNDITLEIEAKDVAILMMLVKVARFANDPTHRDNLVDICGYAALVERCDEARD